MSEQRLYGVYRGTVYSNKDPLSQGRLRVKIPQVLGTQVSEWVWPFNINGVVTESPEVGQGVWVIFEGGDPSFPIWCGVFGKDQGAGYPVSLERLAKSENISDITDLLSLNQPAVSSKQLDITQTLLNITRNRYYGSFYSTQTQSNPVADTPMAITYNQTDSANGISIVDGSRITIHNTGIYNLQFSAQLDKTDSGSDDVDIWLRHAGEDVPWSNTKVTLSGNNAKLVASWNFLLDSNTVDQYWELMWSSADTSMRIYAQGAETGPVRPGIPSVILTVTKVR
jgi:hypothetical protein